MFVRSARVALPHDYKWIAPSHHGAPSLSAAKKSARLASSSRRPKTGMNDSGDNPLLGVILCATTTTTTTTVFFRESFHHHGADEC